MSGQRETVQRVIKIYGIVQGVGFRPFVSRLAARCGIAGSVCNRGSYVEIRATADAETLDQFQAALTREAPPRAVVLKLKAEELPAGEGKDDGRKGVAASDEAFRIIESEHEEGQIFVSPDLATCPDCQRELYDPKDRRYLHPFINCTACGPRLTILDAMPYDRVRTSMGSFPMCPDCAYEYTHASTRRYHAQPVCCPSCGPELSLIGRPERGADALLLVRQILREGGIAAVKGIGGFHLCCDAKDSAAVVRLRTLKHRPYKPFAVMLRDMAILRRECRVPEGAEALLTGPQKPILLLPRRAGDAEICEETAPGNPNLGVMLPYAPVQMLLFAYPGDAPISDALVMTSGNPSGAPICMNDEEAERYLSPLCDVILTNDREIRIRADDTVMAYYRDEPYMVRRSRGYAPLPVILPKAPAHSVLGIGGELKNTFCLAKADLYYPSPYIGDMADVRSVRALEAAVTRMERLLELTPEAVACDRHPRYNTGTVARRIAGQRGIPLIEIQHHYAHIAACMAENEYEDKVIGVSFDGTGYGDDGTVWGGEILACDYRGYERLGSIDPFTQVGGDLAAREGWRVAAALLYEIYGAVAGEGALTLLDLGTEQERQALHFALENDINTIRSTSAGRIFDAISAILGYKERNSFEGEASMALQFAAERARREGREPESYAGRMMNIDEPVLRLSTKELVREITERRAHGADPDALALLFHEVLAEMVVLACCYARLQTRINTAALSGGVFQNTLLLEFTEQGLVREGFRVLRHHLVPPNDGGIALGQAAVAMTRLSAGEISEAGEQRTTYRLPESEWGGCGSAFRKT